MTRQGEGDTCERLVAYLSSLPTLPAVSVSDFGTACGPEQNVALPANNVAY